MGLLNKFVNSKGYKAFMPKLYGWGASVVILGSLFKIMHYPGAGIMLLLGMGTEALIFFFSAFEPGHPVYHWDLVYPELAIGNEQNVEHTKREKKTLPAGTPTQQLDKMLEDAKIGPELIESLATGMRNLSDNARKLSGISDAATVTDAYVSNLTKAAESVRNLSLQYEKTASSMANVNAMEELQALGRNIKTYTDNLNDSLSNMVQYKEEVDKLTKNVAKLSNVYGNMLAAMNVK